MLFWRCNTSTMPEQLDAPVRSSDIAQPITAALPSLCTLSSSAGSLVAFMPMLTTLALP